MTVGLTDRSYVGMAVTRVHRAGAVALNLSQNHQ